MAGSTAPDAPDDRDPVVGAERAVGDAADDEPADVVVPVQAGRAELEAHGGVVPGRGHRREQGLEQGLEGATGLVEAAGGGAAPGVGVDHREVQLALVGLEVDEQIVDLVEHLYGPRVRAVDLVDHDDRREPRLQRLPQHEPGLGQRPLRGVDQEEDAVDQGQRPLDLAAEVGVAGGVDDVDLHPAIGDRGVLGHDRDALLPLEVDGVHDPLGDGLVRAEDAALPEHGVDQGGLPVVHVRDDGDIAEIGPGLHVPPV